MANHPLPLTYQQTTVRKAVTGFISSFMFSLALAIKFSSIIFSIVKEREQKVKHQLIISGTYISAYWLGNFIYDYLLYLLVVLPAAVFCKIFNVISFTTGNAYLSTCLLFTGYGLTYIPFTYIIGFVFKDERRAQSYYFSFTFVIGGIFPLMTFLLRILSSSTNMIGRIIAWILRIDPCFAFG